MPSMAAEDTELTLAEVAASLRVSEDTARKLVSSGEIPGRKQGRQWRVLRSAVENYKQRQRDGQKKQD
jgi:excisionase family DNA binding protein